MDTWLRTCLMLCLYGFFKQFRPSEPFLTEYLIGPPVNLTLEQVNYEVYPVWTYAYLSLLVVVFLLTDLLRYKPMIIFEGIGYVATWSLLLWARGVRWMQFMEFCFGITTSTEIAYYTYIYAQVSNQYYQKVTSFTRAAILFGSFTADLLSQVLISMEVMNYHELNYISLASVGVALIIACMLPSVKSSIYFHRQHYSINREGESSTQLNISETKESWREVTKFIWSDFKTAYSDRYLLKWSIWWAFATCGYCQVGNFTQPLWETIAPDKETDVLYNGLVEALATLLGALAAFAVGYFHLNWSLFGESTMALISLIDGLLLMFMGFTDNILVAYINCIIFRASYQGMMTIASFQVAKQLNADSYGLIFGINMFLALFMQMILTSIVIEGLEVEPKLQFVIYGCFFCVLAIFFMALAAFTFGRLGWKTMKEMGVWNKAQNTSTPIQEAVHVPENETT